MALEVGQVVGAGAATAAPARTRWVFVDAATGKDMAVNHDGEPTEADLTRFKDGMRYSSVKIIRKDVACKTITVQPVDKAGSLEVGQVVGDEDDSQWVLIDEVTETEEEYDDEPTEEDMIAFKDELGYSSVKVVKKEGRRITIRPVDKAGQ